MGDDIILDFLLPLREACTIHRVTYDLIDCKCGMAK